MTISNENEFLGTLLQSVTDAHTMHLATKKFSIHKALNEYYDEAPEAIDALIEAWQGAKGRKIKLKTIDLPGVDVCDPIEYFSALREVCMNGKGLIDEETESDLASELDNVIALIDQTLYKLKELKENKNNMKTTLYESVSMNLKPLSMYLEDKCCGEECGDTKKGKKPILDEGEIASEDDFREYAENKFKEVFGDKLDKKRMDFTIKGLLDDNKDLVEKGEWGELVGMLNKSFGA